MFFKRFFSFVFVLAFIFCMAFSPSAYAVAVVDDVIIVAGVVAVAAVLTGCGIVMADPDVFTSLCESVAELAKLPSTITMSVISGVAYLERSIMAAIVGAAVEAEYFDPLSMEARRDYMLACEHLLTTYTGQWFLFDGFYYPVVPLRFFDSSSFDAGGGARHFGGFSVFYSFSSPTVCQLSFFYMGVEKFSFKFDPSKRLWPFFYPYFISGNLRFVFDGVSRVTIPAVSGGSFVEAPDLPSICPDWGYTDSLPSEDVEGGIVLPGAWADEKNVVHVPSAPGVDVYNPALPVSVPGLDVPTVGAQDQAGAQEGTIADGVIDVPDVDVPAIDSDAATDLEAAKDKLLISDEITKVFPFCIPWDIARGVELLLAPAVEPVFDIPFSFSYKDMSFDHTFTLDFSSFSDVVLIVRWGELFLFILALAYATKRIVWG